MRRDRVDGEQRHVHDGGAEDGAERDDEADLAERIVSRRASRCARSHGVSHTPMAPTTIAGTAMRAPTIMPAPSVDGRERRVAVRPTAM